MDCTGCPIVTPASFRQPPPSPAYPFVFLYLCLYGTSLAEPDNRQRANDGLNLSKLLNTPFIGEQTI